MERTLLFESHRACGRAEPNMEDGRHTENQRIAERLGEMAGLLAAQGANPFRASAYRRAAEVVAGLETDVRSLFDAQGLDGLDALPGVGRSIASAVAEMLTTGRWSQLERLRGAVDPTDLFQRIPGVGPTLARRIHDTLGVDSLEALEAAAHDGRLETVDDIGRRRAASIEASLDRLLARVRRPPSPRAGARREPPVEMLLDVDGQYRSLAAAGRLPTFAPKRFNPSGAAWLPILHTEREGWHFTALFSNTARAHELGTTDDWVVLYFDDDGHHGEGQRTVVTETRGALIGQRVVRGRESECRAVAEEAVSRRASGG